MFRELLIGCGSRRHKAVSLDGTTEFLNVTTLDINPSHNPDVVHDLCDLPLPFPDECFDEIHAYEVLEHTGSQGDYKFFFAQFSDFWRVLKPGGLVCATVPWWQGVWAWGDPSHTRTIQPETLSFLHQPKYTAEIGVTAMSDFRNIYSADFDVVNAGHDDTTLWFVLRAIKPSRKS
jgi:SAM-dependent methyltransferase